MPDDPKIKQPKQVIVEGNDEIRVFNSLSKHLNIRDLQDRGNVPISAWAKLLKMVYGHLKPTLFVL